ncbi:MAG: PEGA domain-containing protein [Myxococcota bacterium]
MQRRSDGRRWGLGLLTLVALLAVGTAAEAKPKKPTPAPEVREVPTTGTVSISSTTTGAKIELDGKLVGTVPLAGPLTLEAGEHTIRAHLRGWSDYTDTFRVEAGGDLELEVDQVPVAGILRVTTAEPGASVAVGGKALGVTPFDQDVAIGKITLTVSRPGYFDDVRELDLEAGQAYDIAVQLKALPPETPKVTQRWWFWTIIGVAVAGGATAAIIAGTGGGSSGPPTPDAVISIP